MNEQNTKTGLSRNPKPGYSQPSASMEPQTEGDAGVTMGLPAATSERGGNCVEASVNIPEPMPTPNNYPAVWDLVIADMQERDQIGERKYGTRLQPHNGRDFLVDVYQESLDRIVYLRGKIYEEQNGLTITFPRLRFVDDNALMRQINKIESEVMEVKGAFLLPGYGLLADELLDTMQACATALMILGEHRGVDLPAAIVSNRKKNRVRGYESRPCD